jgi:hypothetical protein
MANRSISPQTWTLGAEKLTDSDNRVDVLCEGPDPYGAAIAVIELAPMLDLLERVYESRPLRRADNLAGRALDVDIEAILKAHGRLQ